MALVIGANDVINPAARRPGNAVSGRPILDVDQAENVIVIKRSAGHGHPGIDKLVNPKPACSLLMPKWVRASSVAATKVPVATG